MRRSWRWPLAGFLAGGLAGMTVLTANVVGAVGGGVSTAPPQQEQALRELLHTPPVLAARGEAVQLRYDAVCARDEHGAPCSLAGRVYVRGAGGTGFAELPLTSDGEAALSATVPARYARGGRFHYYAVVESDAESLRLPAGGGAAPQVATIVPDWIDVELGEHRFGAPRRPDRTAASAGWGRGERQLGLDSGPEQARIGPSAFDVERDGSVVVLDQVNRRLAVFPRTAAAARHLPIPFLGGEGDLAVGGDGAVHVLDEGGTESRGPIVRTFDPSGRLVGGTPLAARSADMLRISPGGPVAHTYPAQMWMPTGQPRAPLARVEQLGRALAGRPVADGREVLVDASANEARFALVQDDRVVRAWRVTSATNLGEVQLAEPHGTGLLVVLRVWTETEAEFVVLELTPAGVGRSFDVERAEWAESAPLSRFRLDGDSLYQLRSDPNGAEVVAFDVGGTR